MVLLNKENVIFCSSEYVTSKEHGGLAIFLKKFFDILKKDYNIHLVVPSSDSRQFKKDGINIYNVNTNLLIIKILKKFFLPGFFIFQSLLINSKLNKLIKKLSHVKFIHFSNYQCIGLFYNNKFPVITRLSSLQSLWDNYEFFSLSKMLEKHTLSKSDIILSPSNFLIKELKNNYNLKGYFLPPLIEKIKNKKIISKKKIIITFGSISPGKGSLTIEKIINKLLNIDKRVFYYWIGNVDKKYYRSNSFFEKKLKSNTNFPKRVKVINNLNRKKLFKIIKKSQIVILPSLRDNSPNACLEALSMEKPVIARNDSGFNDLIKNKFNGFLFSKKNNFEIIELVTKILSFKIKKKRKLVKNIRYMNRNFYPKEVVKNYKKYVRKIT